MPQISKEKIISLYNELVEKVVVEPLVFASLRVKLELRPIIGKVVIGVPGLHFKKMRDMLLIPKPLKFQMKFFWGVLLN